MIASSVVPGLPKRCVTPSSARSCRNAARPVVFMRAASLDDEEHSGGDPAGFGEVLLPVRRVEAVAAHAFAGRGRMDEAAVAEVDADVRALLALEVEENEVAA